MSGDGREENGSDERQAALEPSQIGGEVFINGTDNANRKGVVSRAN